MFENKQFRKCNDVEYETFASKTNTLIIIKPNGLSSYYQGEHEKFSALLDVNFNEDLVLFAWIGKWRTDIFEVTQADYNNFFLFYKK